MGITLYEHNQTAYASALSMLTETGRAAVIHPTGTGKSFIGLKLAAEHPGSPVFWLSPSEHIFATQIENLKAQAGCEAPKNIRFMTYAKLMACGADEIAAPKPRFVVLDEFHRVGARQWGAGVRRLLSAHPGASVLGLSATSIRYLDNRRDMAAELFGGNVASHMTLGESIVRGILRPPVYITSIYSYHQELRKFQARVRQARNPGQRDRAQRHLDSLRRALDRAEGLGAIFKKHMKGPEGKYIAFCSGLGHMRDMMARVPEWFSGAGGEAKVYSVHSDDPASRREFAAFRQDGSRRLRLLFCIDMLNEGIHVEDVDGVILFRPTVSPIVYKQQIGRALSAGSCKEPVIFDIVNNFESLYSIDSVEEEMREAAGRLREEGLGERVASEGFTLVDEARDCRLIFEQLQESLSASWDAMFALARRYYEERGDLLVPRMHKSNHLSLGLWVETQRKVRKGLISGSLSDERVAKLDSIGMVWDNPTDYQWAAKFAEAKKYYEERGDLDADANHVTESGFRLGSWLANLRRWNNAGARLTDARRRQMDSIGMVWDRNGQRFERNFALAREYFEEHGNLDVPKDGGCGERQRLAQWLCRMRHMRSRGELDARQAGLLDSIGMRWGKKADLAWEENFARAEEHFLKHGSLDVPMSHRTDDGFELGKWLYGHRLALRKGNGGGPKSTVNLTDERKARLDAIGMVWNPETKAEALWRGNFEALREYAEANGGLPSSGAGCESGRRLWQWMYRQRKSLRESRLTEEQARLLGSLGVELR